MLGIGIDTGGTCTDAVLYDLEKGEILACAKAETTHEKLEIGIGKALGRLPRPLMEQASYIALSTTLATNACVENKGGRVCLIFIGVAQKTLEENYARYGFDGTSYMRFLDADPAKQVAPDWARFEEMLPEILEVYDSIAIAQVLPRENNGACEKEARERILRKRKLPVVCAYEIFTDLNVIKRGAGALLNARLLPVIEEFFAAVHHVLEKMHISLPFLIMRSDGSLVSEQYSAAYPVETLLCGPTASVKGAASLMPQKQAIVVDMGGTTSDIALVKDGAPKVNPKGVCVGGWRTLVRGIDIDTFALGGDSQVAYAYGNLFLQPQRVLPVFELASRWPYVLPRLKELADISGGNTKPLYEHLLLMREPTGKEAHFTKRELAVCEALKDGPLDVSALAEKLQIDLYYLHTERLEREGILLRSGFTPTDAMALCGDFTPQEKTEEEMRTGVQAAEYVACFLANSTGCAPVEIAPTVYRLVKEKLYCNLVRILWADAHGDQKAAPKELEVLAKEAFAQETAQTDAPRFFRELFATDAVLLGVGAPIHVFLGDVAKALHTRACLSPYSGVCNALGALLGDACVYETVTIKAEYAISSWDEESERYVVYGDEKEIFPDFDRAAARAAELARERAAQKVRACGAKDVYSLTHTVERKEGNTNLGTILLGGAVTACARGRYY